jgi:hypothetical protein
MPRLNRQTGRLVKDLFKAQRPEMNEGEHHSEEESRISDSIHNKRFLPCVSCAFFIEIKANQQIRAQAHPLPSHEHHCIVVSQNEGKHGEHEEIQIRKEAVIPTVLPHIAG